MDIDDSNEIISKDEFDGIEEGKNIIYKWISLDEIKDADIKPDYLKEKLLNLKDEFEFLCEEDN